MNKFKLYMQKILSMTKKEEMRILPGQLAFFLVLSIVPMIMLVGYFFTTFSISLDSIIGFMNDNFPKEVSNILTPMVNVNINANIIMFMLIAFFLASNGPHSIVVASNMLYGMGSKEYLARRIKAIFMTILLVLLFMFIVFFSAFGSMILKAIIDTNIFNSFGEQIYQVFNFAKWPLSILLIFVVIKILYTMAPDKRIPSRFMNSGALFTTIGWAIGTFIYSYYVSHIANYGLFYGSLSSIVVLMIWVYFLAYIFVLGIAINASSYPKEEPVLETIEEISE